MQRRWATIRIREFLLLIALFAALLAYLQFRLGDGPYSLRLPSSPSAKQMKLKVVAADTLEPVANVTIDLTDVGIYADGGFFTCTTGKNGIASTRYCVSTFQIYLQPPANSRFKKTQYTDQQTMLHCLDDGTFYPSVFRLPVKSSDVPSFLNLAPASRKGNE